MGFRRNRKTLTLTWSLPSELAGLEVRMRAASPVVMRRVVDVAGQAQQGALAERASRILDLCDQVAGLVDGWNYEDEYGAPIPATAAALAGEDVAFVLALVYGWLDALAVRAQQMTDGEEGDAELEASLPVQPLNS